MWVKLNSYTYMYTGGVDVDEEGQEKAFKALIIINK